MAKNQGEAGPDQPSIDPTKTDAGVGGSVDGGNGQPTGAAPARRGRKPKAFGPIAEARAAANERYRTRTGTAAGQNGAPREAVTPPRPTSPGYAKQLVRYHDEIAELLEMPVIKIEIKQALELEQNVMEVLADRNVVLTSPKAHMFALVGCVAMIYGPILIALVRKYLLKPSEAPQAQYMPPPVNVTPIRPQAGQGATRRPEVAPNNPPGIRTVNAHGKPESDVQMFDSGETARGALFQTPPPDTGMSML